MNLIWLHVFWQARRICKTRTVLIACCLVPIGSLIVNIYNLWTMKVFTWQKDAYRQCFFADDQNIDIKSLMRLRISMYFFIPATILLVLNTGIIFRLRQAKTLHDTLTANRASTSHESTGKLRLVSTRILFAS